MDALKAAMAAKKREGTQAGLAAGGKKKWMKRGDAIREQEARRLADIEAKQKEDKEGQEQNQTRHH